MGHRRRDLKAAAADTSTFGERLKQLRTARGWSQSGLAAKAGISQVAVSVLERAIKQPEWYTVRLLADVLEVTPNDFLGEGTQATSSAAPPASQVVATTVLRAAAYILTGRAQWLARKGEATAKRKEESERVRRQATAVGTMCHRREEGQYLRGAPKVSHELAGLILAAACGDTSGNQQLLAAIRGAPAELAAILGALADAGVVPHADGRWTP